MNHLKRKNDFGDRNYTNSGYSAPSTGGLQYVQTNHTELVPKINMEGTIAEFKPGGDLIDVKLYGGDNTQLLQWM